jgi:hypothetical protein
MAQELDTSPNEWSREWSDLDVHHLILNTDEFIVFLDGDLDIDWKTKAKYDEHGPKDPDEYNGILNRAASLECTPNDHHKRNVRLNFKRMIGEAIARALDNDYDSAKKMLDQARLYITNRNVETARYWQLSTACLLGLAVSLSGLGLWAARSHLTEAWGESAYFLIMASFAGSLGAVLSMIFRMGRSFPTSEAPKILHILEAASRVFAGCLSGLLVAAAVNAGLIVPVLRGQGHMHLTMLIGGMASGASERWAPSLVGKFDGSSTPAQPKKAKAQ